MEKLNQITTLAYVKTTALLDNAKKKAVTSIKEFNSDERGVEGFVVALILVGIAAVLAIIFRDKLSEFMNDVMDKVGEILNNPPESGDGG